MDMFIFWFVLLVPVLAGIYTWNYARWAWKKKLKRGAVGLALLALATVALPLFLVFRQS